MKYQINGLLLAVILINSCALIGCHRGYYRRQADADAKRLILEKSTDPRWDSEDGSIEVDPQSRMFNPFSQDHPPIPPDDAASHQFMHRVDGKDGYPHWHANGDTNYVESPTWKSYLPTNENGQVVLNLERAYQLALIHSTDLQQQRETLYQSALDVSLERFGFDSQMFTGFNSFLTTQGRLRNGASSTTLQNQIGANGGGLDIRRAGITGANFAVGLANTILFNFAGANTQSATSLIDFSVIQPLLRGAGRERIMESLTQAERALLANVRQMERFRRGFYLEVAIGRDAGAGPNSSGSFLSSPGAASTNAGGFIGLLQTQQQIRNQEFNVRQLEAVLEQFREFFRVERLDANQLKQFESSFYASQRSLLDSKLGYQTALDRYKVSIGLPPDIDVVIDDPYLDRFELIGDQINERLISIGNLRRQTGAGLDGVYQIFFIKQAEGEDPLTPATPSFWDEFEWPENLASRIKELDKYTSAAEATLEMMVTRDRQELETDIKKLESVRTSRIEHLNKVKQDIASGRINSNVDEGLFEAESLQDAEQLRKTILDPEMDNKEFVINANGQEEIPPRSIMKRAEQLKAELAEVKANIRSFGEAQSTLSKTSKREDGVNLDPELFQYIVQNFQQKIPGLLSELNNLALEMSLLQAQARSNSIELSEVTLTDEHAVRIARCMRRDWMNARASLVDQYRNIEFVADQLEAQVDLVFQGDIGNNGDNPFKIRYETGQLQAGFRFDSPLVRMAERNSYRNALISYQQSKRSFYQFEDSIKSNLRNILRNIDRLKVVFELDRLSVQVAVEQVEINRYELDRPVAPGGGARLGTETARNLTSAIDRLNSTQDRYLRSWVQFEVLRRSLDFDMGTMQVQETGEWLDPGAMDSSLATRAASMMGIQLDCQFCENVEFSFADDSQLAPQEYMAPEGANSLNFEAGGFNEPLGLPNSSDPSVLEFDSRSNSLQLDGAIEPVSPFEDLGTSSLQRSNLIPRNLFQPVRSAPKFSKKKIASPAKPARMAAIKNAETKATVTKKLPTKATSVTMAKMSEAPIVAKFEQTPKAIENKQASIPKSVIKIESPITAMQPASPTPSTILPPFYVEPLIDVSTSQDFQNLSMINGSLTNKLTLMDEELMDDRLQRVSFWSFFEGNTDEAKIGELIESSIADPVAQTVRQASAESPVEQPAEKLIEPSKLLPKVKAPIKIAAQTALKNHLPAAIVPKLASKAPKEIKPMPLQPLVANNPNATRLHQASEPVENWQQQKSSLGGVLNRFRSK